MELTENFISGLNVDEIAIIRKIASEIKIRADQVSAVISLIGEGCTVPFISRYRKEKTGSLDEVQVRDSAHSFESYKNLEERRIDVIKGIFALGKLDEALYDNIAKAATLAEIEDLWAPFKKKKKTRGMLAQEKGLSPLAEIMLKENDAAVEAAAPGFVRVDEEHPELTVASAADAIAGAMDIVAERMSQNPENRATVKSFYLRTGNLRTAGVGDEAKRATSTYQMYWDYSEPLGQLKPHRVLAVNRAEREGELTLTIEVDQDGAIALLKDRAWINNKYHADAIADGLVRLLSPAVVREIRSDAGEHADGHSITVFSTNLKNLLMSPPIKGTRVLGVDPGIRTGTKCAALDETGKYLDYFVIFQEQKAAEGGKAIAAAVKRHDLKLIAVGNGTGSHEVQLLVAKTIEEEGLDCAFTVVDEDGASVYSASDVAREEFPDLDLTIRGAISIGRRLQDPLAELVKIDPKSIGVGLYQHDVNQRKLSDSLDEVVGSVVNNVGVNLNTASHSLLRYVSGINAGLAKKIVKFRETSGVIAGRHQLRDIPGLGEKTFEQCAGFLKIPESANPLDNTWVHPENYSLAEELLPIVKNHGDVTRDIRLALKEKYKVGDTTLDDILVELKKPNRDPREGFPAPILQKGVVLFADLAEGMTVRGKVKNVVDFGAFVDIGIKESALIHVSEMSDRFIKDPMDVLKVGDVKDFTIISLDLARKRIGLSLKTDRGAQRGKNASPRESFAPRDAAGPRDAAAAPRESFAHRDEPARRPAPLAREMSSGPGRDAAAGHEGAAGRDSRAQSGSGEGAGVQRRAVLVRKAAPADGNEAAGSPTHAGGDRVAPAKPADSGSRDSRPPRPAPGAPGRVGPDSARAGQDSGRGAGSGLGQGPSRPGAPNPGGAGQGASHGATRPGPVYPGAPNPGAPSSGGPGRGPASPRRDEPRREKEDDGMTYNPFAELLKNKKR